MIDQQVLHYLARVMAGYSDKPLIDKLGIKPDSIVLLINEPAEYISWINQSVKGQLAGSKKVPDFIHLFAKDQQEFVNGMKKIKPICGKNPRIVVWVSWYKQSSKIPTDLTETFIRNYALQNGLVDVKVCAVSENWSGLKLVVPVKLR